MREGRRDAREKGCWMRRRDRPDAEEAEREGGVGTKVGGRRERVRKGEKNQS